MFCYSGHSLYLWEMTVRLRQLEYFVAIAENRSITAAAGALLVAQPSLSHQIHALETELGARLLERLPRGIQLTPAGRIFLEEARNTLEAAARASRRVRQVEGNEFGDIHIGTVRSLSVGVLPTAIGAWHSQYPKIGFNLREFSHADRLEEAIRSGYGDIGVGPMPAQEFPAQIELGQEEFVVVLPPFDPLANEHTMDLRKLSNRKWVLFASGYGLSDIVLSACRQAGFTPAGSVYTYQIEAAVRLASVGMGPALVPRNVVPADTAAAVIPLDRPLTRTLSVFAREAFNSLVLSYIETLKEAVAKHANS